MSTTDPKPLTHDELLKLSSNADELLASGNPQKAAIGALLIGARLARTVAALLPAEGASRLLGARGLGHGRLSECGMNLPSP
jgi:hypothetical protein